MSEEIRSIDDLKKTAEMEEKSIKKQEGPRPGTEEYYMQQAVKREEEKKAEMEREAEEALNRERELDGREYEYMVEGFNIGDAIMRRAHTIDDNGRALSEKLANEELEKEITTDEALNSEDASFDDELSEGLNDDDLSVEDDTESNADNVIPITNIKNNEITKEKKNDVVDITNITQDDLNIDDEDLLDIADLENEPDYTDDEDELTQEELSGLRDAIKEKLAIKAPVGKDGSIKVSTKAVSLNDILSVQESNVNVVDYPLMSSGKRVSMKEFSGTEIESLNQGSSGRNRFNTLKTIYHTIWDHIADKNKPDFDEWLKVTSFMDIDHYYMAIYKACFNGANYIPFSCEDESCGHIFLSDDLDIESNMIKFKDEDAKKKFYDILNNTDVMTKEASSLYETKIVPVSPSIAIGFREPSIYNTIFENSVLDQKFIDKYTKLLTMMVYIDNIYLIQNGEYRPLKLKTDKTSIAKTTKYRIATFAKIIKSLNSDHYNNIIIEISKINDLGDEIKYQLPEMVCPKCGKKIKAAEQTATQLLFSRHQLNLLSQES